MAQTVSKGRSFAGFEAVYCSGIFVPDGALVTALAILFDRVHIPNYVEYALEFPRRFKIVAMGQPMSSVTEVESKFEFGPEPPGFDKLSGEQRTTFKLYLSQAASFYRRYHELFGPVFDSSSNPMKNIKAIQVGPSLEPGKKLWRVETRVAFTLDEGAQPYTDRLISAGVIPVLGAYHVPAVDVAHTERVARYVASVLAINAARLVLPATRPTSAEIILEARHRLREYLPPFWAAMMSLSASLRAMARNLNDKTELNRAAAELTDTLVYPALIDLRRKMRADRRRWFHQILSQGRNTLRFMMGRADVTTSDLISAGLMLGANVALDVAEEVATVTPPTAQGQLAALIHLDRALRP